MSSGPQLSLGQPPAALQKTLEPRGRSGLFLLWLTNLAVLAGVAALWFRVAQPHGQVSPLASGSAAELKAVAAQLEDKSLEAEAARAWEAYLAADPLCSERAEIYFRAGRLYMQAEQFGPAAAALIRGEQAAGKNGDLKQKIGPAMVECLNRLGRYGEVGRELSRRVEPGGKEASDGKAARTLATLTGRKLTEADLDRMIERRVDRMLAMQGGDDPHQRQAILQQMAAPEVRRRLLEELLRTELFSRRARELGLDRDEGFQQAREQLAQNLLTERFLARELEKIKPTDVDVESYFKANLAQYETPESLQVVVLPLGAKDDPQKMLTEIKSADDFRKLARQRQAAGADAKGELTRRVARGRNDPELGDVEPLFQVAEGAWTKEPLVRQQERFLVLVEKKTPRVTPRLQDVQRQVRADYTARKQQELAEKLFADLMQRYDVRIMAETPAKP